MPAANLAAAIGVVYHSARGASSKKEKKRSVDREDAPMYNVPMTDDIGPYTTTEMIELAELVFQHVQSKPHAPEWELESDVRAITDMYAEARNLRWKKLAKPVKV